MSQPKKAPAKPKSAYIKPNPRMITRKEFVETHNNLVIFDNTQYTSWRDYLLAYVAKYQANEVYTNAILISMINDTLRNHIVKFDYMMAMTVFKGEGLPGRIVKFRRLLIGDFDYIDDNVVRFGPGKCHVCGAKATHGTHTSVSEHNPFGVATVCKTHHDTVLHVKTAPNTCKHIENRVKCGTQPCYRKKGTTKYTHCAPHANDIEGDRESKYPMCTGTETEACPARTVATFGPKGTSQRLKCRDCNINGNYGYVDTCNQLCPKDHKKDGKTITKQAKFNFRGQKSGIYCKEHRLPLMINVMAPKCGEPNCDVYPSYSSPNINGLYCVSHKIAGMTQQYARRCKECPTYASFNIETERKPIYCYAHRKGGMVDVINRKCELCSSQPIYAPRGSLKTTRCGAHHVKGMVNLRSDMCTALGCEKYASFAATPNGRAERCRDHKDLHKYNVKDKYCVDCMKDYATWGKESRTHCTKCKTEGMLLFSGRLCKKCRRRHATYNFKDLKPIYCGGCQEEGMIDTKSKRCQVDGCNKHARKGFLFRPAIHCASHASGNEYVVRKPECVIENCTNGAIYAIGGNYPIVCENHVEPNTAYVNVSEKQCEKCHQTYYLNDKDPVCNVCKGERLGYKHLKEKRVEEVLRENNVEVYLRDAPVDLINCSKKRPDFAIDCGTHMIVVEVDENQHGAYTPECEMTRMVTIYQDIGMECTIFIRYNPDTYTDNTGEKITGKPANPSRERVLLDTIEFLKADPIPALWVVELFYDGYDGRPVFKKHDYFGRPCE